MLSEQVFADWYYSVELEPGRFTKGIDHTNIAVTRSCIDSIDVNGRSVLDLSTMEGMFATLLAKRGAIVTTTDTIDLTPRVNLLKTAHKTSFNYLPHCPPGDSVQYLFEYQTSTSYSPSKPLKSSAVTPYGYDIVLSSGVMYHVLSPLQYIIQLRRLTKLGGLVIIETACAINDEIEMYNNYRHGSFVYRTGWTSWFLSTRAIDIFLRACFFHPIGFSYIKSEKTSDLNVIRLGVVAKAIHHRAFDPTLLAVIDDGEIIRSYDYKPLYESAQLTGQTSSETVYKSNIINPINDYLNSYLLTQTPEVSFNSNYLRLSLSDR